MLARMWTRGWDVFCPGALQHAWHAAASWHGRGRQCCSWCCAGSSACAESCGVSWAPQPCPSPSTSGPAPSANTPSSATWAWPCHRTLRRLRQRQTVTRGGVVRHRPTAVERRARAQARWRWVTRMRKAALRAGAAGSGSRRHVCSARARHACSPHCGLGMRRRGPGRRRAPLEEERRMRQGTHGAGLWAALWAWARCGGCRSGGRGAGGACTGSWRA
jgi:hypothetical protein